MGRKNKITTNTECLGCGKKSKLALCDNCENKYQKRNPKNKRRKVDEVFLR